MGTTTSTREVGDTVTNTRLALLLSRTVYSIPLLVLGINNMVPYQAEERALVG